MPKVETKKTRRFLPLEFWQSLTGKAKAASLSAGFIAMLIIAFGGYKIYENQVTGGVGFKQAADLQFPEDIPVAVKKKAFFDFMRPIAEAENARILEKRERILKAREDGNNPGWLRDLAEAYDVEWTGQEWKRLLMRIDTVPLTLILAQSANESSWGQSKFAQEGNNMFGQWCFSKGCGIVPARRDPGKFHEIAAYWSVNDSVRAYINNINRTRAYASLRAMRWQARQNDQTPEGEQLAYGLLSYSERREAYVKEIQNMIRVNRELMLARDEAR